MNLLVELVGRLLSAVTLGRGNATKHCFIASLDWNLR
jgi:hypothetical protein